MKGYVFHPNLILRTPLLPLCLDISEERIRQELKKQEIEEAIYLSSPQFHSKMKEYLTTSLSREVVKENKLLNSLRKYLMRMRTRCTPFGLFASCAVVEWDRESRIKVNLNNQLRRTRLDMQFLCELIQYISSQPYYQAKLLYYPNNSIYKSFDRYRFIEHYFKDNIRYHQISSVRWSEYLEALLNVSKNGCRLDELANTIVENDISFEEASSFVGQLVEAQLLVSELDANVTGIPVLERIISFLSKYNIKETPDFSLLLKNVKYKLKQLDSNKFNSIESYSNIQKDIQKLGISFEDSKLIQTDSFRIIPDGVLSNKVKSSINNIFPLLHKLSWISEENNLQRFKNAFLEKYEYEEKSLAEVLDTERGIGYPENSSVNVSTPLIEGISSNFKSTFRINWTSRETLLFRIAQEAIYSKAIEVDLAKYEQDILKLETNADELPVSMSVIFDVVEVKNNQYKIHFKGAFGPSAVTLIGRFADGYQPINKIVNDIASHEESFYLKQQIELAEIVHLPESRIGNVLFRPSFRKYEIPYLANSMLKKDYQLDISDLMVSIKNDEIILRSEKLNKRILPRLGNAHAYDIKALPIYQFLADLQFQNVNNGLRFDWGALRTEFTYLPRVIYKGIILARAEWNFSGKELKKFIKKPKTILGEWIEKYKLPNLVVLVEGENEFLINFEDSLSINILLSESKKKGYLLLKEFLFSETAPLIKDEKEAPYTNEFIAFLLKENTQNNSPKIALDKSSNSVVRTFAPGAEWMYFKIYCGYKTSDRVITEYLLPFAEILERENKIKKWFYIRYNDPDSHIRFRLLVKDKLIIGEVIRRFYELIKPLSNYGVIHKIQLDTYKRELERYGGNFIDLAESIFYFDSKCIANFLSLLEGEEGEKYRWFFAMLSIDKLLGDFLIDLEKKILLLESLKKGFAEEFKVNKIIKDQINAKYRTHRQEINQLFILGSDLREEMRPALELLDLRSKEIANCVSIYSQNKNQLNYEGLLDSYIHMICNRLFINAQRKHELVIYDFMFKYYKSSKMKGLSILMNNKIF